MKKVLGIFSAQHQHWVGDGFPVRSLFSYNSHAEQLSPFLLLDYAGPMQFEPAESPRGVGEHPHRGFETVTIVYDGEVSHRDSTGAGGSIGPGDVQWMTAASGILHEEFHSPDFTREGGTLEMIQLWVNLPASDKMSDPKYQDILSRDIPNVALADDAGEVRVIAGEFQGHSGPAQTFTPIDVWDVRLKHGHRAQFSFVEGRTVALVVLSGNVSINGDAVHEAQFALMDPKDREVSIDVSSDATLLVLSGEPLNEPVVGQGPFVMNTATEIRQAIQDFSSGQFGRIGG